MRKLFILFALPASILLTACGPAAAAITPINTVETQPVAIIAKAPTATNFPRIGTATPVPPTPTSNLTASPTANVRSFTDETLAEMMAGTISSAGISAKVDIVDERGSGKDRRAEIVIVSDYNIEDSELLLKLFVLEVGNALRTVRAFSEGSMNADLDSAHMVVVDKQNNLLGTVTAPMPYIVSFLDGKLSVDEALAKLELTGVFETFRK